MTDFENNDVLKPGQSIRPNANKNIAIDLIHRLYGLKVKEIFELNAYDDKNFHVICDSDFNNPWIDGVSSNGYVLKIINSLDSKKTNFIDGQTNLLIFLNDNQINCPVPVKNLKNLYYSVETIDEGSEEEHAVRLLTYIPGKLLNQFKVSNELLIDVGKFTGSIDEVLKKFHHQSYEEYRSLWMLNSVPKLRDFIYAVDKAERRFMVNEIIVKFEKEVMQEIDELETGIIHGDLNEQNIIVDESGNNVFAILDFGDSQKSCLIFELAIALCYMILNTKDLSRGKYVVKGYQSIRKLTEFEKRILKICVCARLCQSLVLGAYSHSNDPKNQYLLVTQKPGWALLYELWPIANDEVLKIWEL